MSSGNPYEERRQQRIRKNRCLLESIGLLGAAATLTANHSRPKASRKSALAVQPSAAPTRRSLRTMSQHEGSDPSDSPVRQPLADLSPFTDRLQQRAHLSPASATAARKLLSDSDVDEMVLSSGAVRPADLQASGMSFGEAITRWAPSRRQLAPPQARLQHLRTLCPLSRVRCCYVNELRHACCGATIPPATHTFDMQLAPLLRACSTIALVLIGPS